MQAQIDKARCQGHTLCAMNAPELFDVNEDDGYAAARDGDVPAALEPLARLAAQGCPERAILLQD
ncbi:Ferredoxin-2 (fragment) [Frankia canadensis]|uniref:Ferredoxin-2 n=1 Tax=Frankia canadensis TaxID=1836972 RepID=A0A2I2KI28_9ACTN